MAVVTASNKNIMSAAGGAFSQLSRAQYGALARMRWTVFRNSIRSTQGAMELGARSVAVAVYAIMGLGLAFGVGVGAYFMASSENWKFLPVLFWAVFVVWQVVPISVASFQEQFDLSGLLRFPVSFGAFYSLYLIFGLIDVSTILGGFCCLGLEVGFAIARPSLAGWAALSLLIFAAFNFFLVRAIFAWIDRWLAQRRTREIVSALFLVCILGLQFLNPAMGLVKYRSPNSHGAQSQRQRMQMQYGPWLRKAAAIQSWLPPGLAARAIHEGVQEQPGMALESLSLLGLYAIGAGGALAARLRGEFRGENLGSAPKRNETERHSGRWLLDGSGPVAAVLEKEVRVLMRALPLLYAIGAPLIMVFILSGVYRKIGNVPGHIPMGLLISLAYAMIGFTQIFYNNLGGEGGGIQLILLAPTPIRTVMLAKNIFHSLLFGLDVVVVCVLASLRYGRPDPVAMTATVAWLLFALPVHLAVGNIFSVNMPYRINLGRISRQKGSQASALLSLLVQLGVFGIGAGIFALCAFFGRVWLAIPIFLVLAGGAVFAWIRVLAEMDAMVGRKREHLVATLAKAE